MQRLLLASAVTALLCLLLQCGCASAQCETCRDEAQCCDGTFCCSGRGNTSSSFCCDRSSESCCMGTSVGG